MILREGCAVFDMMELTLTGQPIVEAARESLGKEHAALILEILHGQQGPELLQVAHTVDVFSRYGIIFLLFMVGLETSVEEMRQVGIEPIRVAILGVVLPFLLGLGLTYFLLPEISLNTDLFIAAALVATSIGITARVLRDMQQEKSHEARVILSAAVVDDILGLIVLAVVSGIIVSGGVELGNIVKTITLAMLFLASAVVLGPTFLRFTIKLIDHLDIVEAKMFISFLFVMVLAWFANLVGLATIIGAFTAGVILHDAYFEHWGDHKEHPYSIRDLIMPLEVILVPIFFVLMGVQVKLELFLDWNVVVVAAGLLVVAVIGKLASGLGASKGTNRLAVGFGMVPRGEVGLIFAAVGMSLGVIDDALFASLVLMVIITTLMAPPLIKLCLLTRSTYDIE